MTSNACCQPGTMCTVGTPRCSSGVSIVPVGALAAAAPVSNAVAVITQNSCGCLELQVCPCRTTQYHQPEIVNSCSCAGSPTCACAIAPPKDVYTVDSCGCLHKARCSCRAPVPQIQEFSCCRVSPCDGLEKCSGKSAELSAKKAAELEKATRLVNKAKAKLRKAKMIAEMKKMKKEQEQQRQKRKQARDIKKQLKLDFKKMLRERLAAAGIKPSDLRKKTTDCGCQQFVEAQEVESTACPCAQQRIVQAAPACCQAEPCVMQLRCANTAVVSGIVTNGVSASDVPPCPVGASCQM